MLFAFENGQAVHVGPEPTRKESVAVVQQVVGRDLIGVIVRRRHRRHVCPYMRTRTYSTKKYNHRYDEYDLLLVGGVELFFN
jgi:hypothetical protein